MRSTHLRCARAWLAAVGGGLSLTVLGCEPGPQAPRESISTRVVFDASALFGTSHAQDGITTVVELAELTVVTAGSDVQSQQDSLGPDQPQVSFNVVVPPGPTTFQGRVLSNNGTTLFEGLQELVVENDGFQVDLELQPVAPVLVVTPDTVEVTTEPDQVFLVENRGVRDLAWSADTVGLDSRFDFNRVRGQVEEGAPPDTFLVMWTGTGADGPAVHTIRLDSPEGHVEVHVRTR